MSRNPVTFNSVVILTVAAAIAFAVGVETQGLPTSWPEFTAPPDSKAIGCGSSNVELSRGGRVVGLPIAGADRRSSTGANCRFETTATTAAVANHFVPQLTALKWQETYRKDLPGMNYVRFSSGTPDDPLVGFLTVIAFPEKKNVLVAIDLLRSRAPWGTPGGAGRGSPSAGPVMLLSDFTHSTVTFPEFVRLPPVVTRLENRGGGGSPTFSQDEYRLEAPLSPAALMKIIEPQIRMGWAVDLRAGDALQEVVKFNPPTGGDSTAIMYVTMMPGVRETSVLLTTLRHR